MRKVYLGSFDDRVLEYPWELRKPNLGSYINLIIQNVLIGSRPVVNDGYCVNNRILRKAIFEDKNPLLHKVIESGNIIIPGRHSSFNKLVEEQADKGIETFREIPDSVLREMDGVDRQLVQANAREVGPNSSDVWNSYFFMISKIQGKTPSELGLSPRQVTERDLNTTLEKFLNYPTEGKPPSRNEWEKILLNLAKQKKLSQRYVTVHALMALANEYYHTNFVSNLNTNSPTVGVETRFTKALSDYYREDKLALDHAPGDIPLIEIPAQNQPFTDKAIELILDPNTGVGSARLYFIKSLDQLTNKELGGDSLKILIGAADTYNRELKSVFPKNIPFGKQLNLALSTVAAATLPSGVTYAILAWFGADFASEIVQRFIGKPVRIDYRSQMMFTGPQPKV